MNKLPGQQRLATYDQRFQGSSFVRSLFHEAVENGDFLLDHAPVAGGQSIGFIRLEGSFNTAFPASDLEAGFNDTVQDFAVGSHAETLTLKAQEAQQKGEG